MITASKTPLADLFAAGGLTSPFHNIFQLIELGPLSAAEANELLERGLSCDRPFTLDDCRRLRRLAGQQPYQLQVAASLLYEAHAEPPVDWQALEWVITSRSLSRCARPRSNHFSYACYLP